MFAMRPSLFVLLFILFIFLGKGAPGQAVKPGEETLICLTGDRILKLRLALDRDGGAATIVKQQAAVKSIAAGQKAGPITAIQYSPAAGWLAVQQWADRDESSSPTLRLINEPSGRNIVLAGASRPSFSSDGKFFCYTRQGARETGDTVPVCAVDGLRLQPVAQLPGRHGQFSPRAAELLYDAITGTTTQVMLFEPATHKAALVWQDARAARWSPDGSRALLYENVSEKNTFEDSMILLGMKHRDVIYRQRAVNLQEPVFSPQNHFLALHSHLSRPLTGHFIVGLDRDAPPEAEGEIPGYAPPLYYEWSADEHWLLAEYRLPDPSNEGTWLSQELWLVSVDLKIKKKIQRVEHLKSVWSSAARSNFRFVLNGRAVVWIDDARRLMYVPVQDPGRKQKLLDDVRLIGDSDEFGDRPGHD